MSTALLVIDAQNAFFDRALGQPVFEAASVLANLTGLLARARHQNVPVIFVQHCEDEGEFARSDPRWLLHTDLGVRADEPVIEKTTPDSFYHTGLAAILDRHNAQHLVIAGNQTEFCVDTTCRAAKSRSYRVTLAADAHSTWDTPNLAAVQIIAHHNYVLGSGFADVMPSAEIALG